MSGALTAPARRVRRCTGVVAGLCCLTALFGGTPVRAGLGPTPPPLPPQPGVALGPHTAQGCGLPQPAPGAWSLVTEKVVDGSVIQPYQVAVDPWDPCVMYSAEDAQTLRRSADGGRSWRTVFHDDRTGAYEDPITGLPLMQTPAFDASGIVIPSPHAVMLPEVADGDALVSSRDAGRSWVLHDRGLAGQPVESVVFAPHDPAVGYAVRQDTVGSDAVPARSLVVGSNKQEMPVAAAPEAVEVTRDGGETWTPASPLPSAVDVVGGALSSAIATSVVLQVDPADPARLWAAVNLGVFGVAGATVVYASTDYAAHWTYQTVITPTVSSSTLALQLVTGVSVSVQQLVAIRTPHHPLRLVAVVGSFPQGEVAYSDDGGVSWFASPLPNGLPGALAVDPVNGDRMMYVTTGFAQNASGSTYPVLLPYYTVDAFDTVIALRNPRSGALSGSAPMGPGDGLPPSTSMVEADRAGDFYVAVAWSCSGFALAPDCTTVPRSGVSYYRMAPPPYPASLAFATAGGGARGATSTSPPAVPLVDLKTCPLPSPGGQNGALAYDGRDLLYTQHDEVGPAPYQGVIHRMNAATCLDDGSLVVHFSPADIQTLALHNRYPSGDRTSVDTLVYDARRGVLWVTLQVGSGYLFTVDVPADVGGTSVAVDAHLRFHGGQGCVPFLAYDSSDDALWTCEGPVDAGTGGARLDSCNVATLNIFVPFGPATWTATAPHHLMIQSEDDTTLAEYDTASCTTVARYAHRPFSEPPEEDEQMACDPLTFGPDSQSLVHTTALWLRDAVSSTVTAYALPTGACPLATTTTFLGPTRARPGESVALCGRLQRGGLGTPLAQRRLDFYLDGVPRGSGVTDASGVACTTAFGAPAVTRTHPVDVRFDGDFADLPSASTGALAVIAFPIPFAAPPPQPQGLLPVVQPPTQPVNAPAANPAPAAQAQTVPAAQLQPQVQPQAQAAAQPVAAAQHEEQTQLQMALAEQRVGHEQAQEQLEMSALAAPAETIDPVFGLVGVAGLAGFVGLGLAWMLRVPEHAVAHGRQARRRRGRRTRSR